MLGDGVSLLQNSHCLRFSTRSSIDLCFTSVSLLMVIAHCLTVIDLHWRKTVHSLHAYRLLYILVERISIFSCVTDHVNITPECCLIVLGGGFSLL